MIPYGKLWALCSVSVLLASTLAEIAENVCREQAVGRELCPELFLLGAQKCGSTAVFRALTENFKLDLTLPVGIPLVKEPQFFNYFYDRGWSWYIGAYGLRKSTDQVGIDASADYTAFAQAPVRIQAGMNAERLRFIMIMRDPVQRAYSWYTHVHAFGMFYENYREAYLCFDYKFSLMSKYATEAIAKCMLAAGSPPEVFPACYHTARSQAYPSYHDHHVYIEETGMTTAYFDIIAYHFTSGLYGYILSHWFKFFRPEQFCFLVYENMVENPLSELAYLKPCIEHFGRQINLETRSVELPKANVQVCKNCAYYEQLSEESLKTVGATLHRELYLDSNELVRRSLRELYNRTDVKLWEIDYGSGYQLPGSVGEDLRLGA
ncbi:hypothetical protein NDN08_004507 [Rhodosorus marinus]|uniref:Sulfotransferase domain-containing protein n=1 Tax=Rhodosorus marinus TaxID=101924 RepID=A0AAV8UMY5_9RHOD|nr:hypothetical protein NDN08_004507 [Rhodosorus marinus]